MKGKTFLILTITMILVLTACRSESEQPTATATEPVVDAALTQSAQTIIAQLTQSVAGTWTPVPSPTSWPTFTPPAPTTTGPTPTPTDTSLPTETGLASTPTETGPPSTTPLPTFTSEPTFVPGDPRGELGVPDWQADFTLETDWYAFDAENASILRRNGTLVLTGKNSDISEVWGLSYPVLSDFYLEYTINTGRDCIGRDRYGMVVRAPTPNEGYLFGVSCDGAFRVLYWDGNEFTTLQDWAETEFINTGPGVFNRLGVKAQGNKLSLYANGNLLADIEDDRLSEGKFGAFIKGESTAGFRVTVTEVLYWDYDK